jgi:carboxymethylenebutenolidase
MPRVDTTIRTRDGICPLSLFTPAVGTGPWPGVIFFMDALGIRPSMWQMGQSLADGGYAVLVPDCFYRLGSRPPQVPAEVFADPKSVEQLMKDIGSYDRERRLIDIGAFIDVLSSRPEAQHGLLACTGYCMGGNLALTAAGAFPDAFAAAASFHGGNIAADAPDSPHRFLGEFRGRIYVAGAVEDRSFPDEQKMRLEATLTAAGIDHRIETYEGAHHGFAVPDHPAYNAAADRRHREALASLLSGAFAGA